MFYLSSLPRASFAHSCHCSPNATDIAVFTKDESFFGRSPIQKPPTEVDDSRTAHFRHRQLPSRMIFFSSVHISRLVVILFRRTRTSRKVHGQSDRVMRIHIWTVQRFARRTMSRRVFTISVIPTGMVSYSRKCRPNVGSGLIGVFPSRGVAGKLIARFTSGFPLVSRNLVFPGWELPIFT